MPFEEFARLYCETQKATPESLARILMAQKIKFSPIGWFLGECQVLDSSCAGARVILPYGENNTFKTPPNMFSPRGLASDTSVVIAVMSVEEFDAYVDSLPIKA